VTGRAPVVALPAMDLRLGLPSDGGLGEETTQPHAYDLLGEDFGPAFNGAAQPTVSTMPVSRSDIRQRTSICFCRSNRRRIGRRTGGPFEPNRGA
jgi:hypothetical protein